MAVIQEPEVSHLYIAGDKEQKGGWDVGFLVSFLCYVVFTLISGVVAVVKLHDMVPT